MGQGIEMVIGQLWESGGHSSRPYRPKTDLEAGGGDSVPDMDSGSLFHFSHHCSMEDFRRFISISHTVSHWPIFTILGNAEMIHAKKRMNPIYFGSDQADIRIRISL